MIKMDSIGGLDATNAFFGVTKYMTHNYKVNREWTFNSAVPPKMQTTPNIPIIFWHSNLASGAAATKINYNVDFRVTYKDF